MTHKKIKVFLFIPSLSAGGAERVMLFIAKNLSQDKFDISLIVTGYEKDSIYTTHGVNITYLNETKVQKSLFKIIKLLKHGKPDIVFGTLTHVNQIIGLVSYLFPKIICVTRETYIISEGKKNSHKQSFFRRTKNTLIERLANKRMDYVICQSKDMKNDLIGTEIYDPKKLLVINNPVSNEIKTKNATPFNKHLKLITVGRLKKQKGYERILKCLTKLDIEFTYTIIGDGPEKEQLFDLAKNLKIINKLNHIPLSTNVYTLLAENHVYLQGSYYEGFPNALIESLGVGTPAIVYNAPGGMNEIIINDENGYLVENDEEFIEKLKSLSNNLEKFNPSKVTNHVINSFGWEKVINDYENFFEKITGGRLN